MAEKAVPTGSVPRNKREAPAKHRVVFANWGAGTRKSRPSRENRGMTHHAVDAGRVATIATIANLDRFQAQPYGKYTIQAH